jgi:uncharacterized protein
MKYAVVILVVLLGVWLWRKNRADDRKEMAAKPKRKDAAPVGTPQIMVSCAVCGVHLPQSDAVLGKIKHYCSLAHRQQREPG